MSADHAASGSRSTLAAQQPEAELLVLGHYSPSSSPTKKTPDTTAKTSHTAPTALLTGTTKPKPMASIVAVIKPTTAISEAFIICSRLSRIGSWLPADMQRKLAPPSAVVGAKRR